MMLPIAARFDLDVHILDTPGAVCQDFCLGFIPGDFRNAHDVITAFGDREFVTMDLEDVSLEGILELEKRGVKIAPSASVIGLIQNKVEQKKFFALHNLPTSRFEVLEAVNDNTPDGFLKLPTGGYDGKGVVSYKGDKAQLPPAFQKNVLWEERVPIAQEISVIVARNSFGELKSYTSTEMVFDPELNLISYTLFPARLSPELEHEAQRLAKTVMEKINGVGVMAVEMFVTKEEKILINELAPRPHNSGHHTIESCVTSQYENHLRGVLGLPLGACDARSMALTFNLIGTGSGETQVTGHEELLAEAGCAIHLYGKKDCRPGRKMGHVTLIGRDYNELIEKYQRLNPIIKITGERNE